MVRYFQFASGVYCSTSAMSLVRRAIGGNELGSLVYLSLQFDAHFLATRVLGSRNENDVSDGPELAHLNNLSF